MNKNSGQVLPLISELRERIKQLEKVSEQIFLFHAESLSSWIFLRREFKDALVELDKIINGRIAIKSQYGDVLADCIRKEWNTILLYKQHFNSLNERASFSLKLMDECMGDKRSLGVEEAYHHIRYIKEGLLSIGEVHDEMIKKKEVALNDEGQVLDYSSNLTHRAWMEYMSVGDVLEGEGEHDICSSIGDLKYLSVMKSEWDWKIQFESWREMFGSKYYIPKFQILTNYLYDFYILGEKPRNQVKNLKKLEVKDIRYNLNQIANDQFELKVEPGYGQLLFDGRKSSNMNGRYVIGDFVKEVVEKPSGVLESELKKIGLSESEIITSIYHVNSRFGKAARDQQLKLWLSIQRIQQNGPALALTAYRFRLPTIKDTHQG